MFKYEKMLPYPINITKKDLKMAKYLITQFGGPNGELNAAMRYFSQKFTMPDSKGRALLNDIATEELSHCEMICTMVHQLTKNATLEELEKAGLTGQYVEHNKGIFPSDSFGNKYEATFHTSGDPLVDLSEDMAAEEKARATYENLIDIATDKELISILLFLRQREVIHYNLFKKLREYYISKGLK